MQNCDKTWDLNYNHTFWLKCVNFKVRRSTKNRLSNEYRSPLLNFISVLIFGKIIGAVTASAVPVQHPWNIDDYTDYMFNIWVISFEE